MESRGEVGWGAGGERQRLAMGSAPGEPSLGGCGGRGVAPVPSARDLELQLREAPESHLPRPWPVSPPHISPPSRVSSTPSAGQPPAPAWAARDLEDGALGIDAGRAGRACGRRSSTGGAPTALGSAGNKGGASVRRGPFRGAAIAPGHGGDLVGGGGRHSWGHSVRALAMEDEGARRPRSRARSQGRHGAGSRRYKWDLLGSGKLFASAFLTVKWGLW